MLNLWRTKGVYYMDYMKLVKHYEDCYRKNGDNNRGVDWPNKEDALTRYGVMLDVIRYDKVNTEKPSVLDFGCGYGPIGIYIAKNTNANVDMIDINERALKLSKDNAKINKVDVNIFESDIYTNITKKYDYIITNPPIRVGKKILYKILIGAKDYLKKEGHLIFVINKDNYI